MGVRGLSLVSPPSGVHVPLLCTVYPREQLEEGSPEGQAGRGGGEGSDAFRILTGVKGQDGERTEMTHSCSQKSPYCSEALCDI